MSLNPDDRKALKAYAANELDLTLNMNMSAAQMRDEIEKKCKELQIETPAYELHAKGASTASQGGVKRINIMIPKSEKPGGTEPVFVSVQGVSYTIPRGHKVAVPEAVVEVLNNAITTIVTQSTDGELHQEDVPTYPFQTFGNAA